MTLRYRFTLVALLPLLFIACTVSRQLMPSPNLYVRGGFDPFADVPPALQNNGADVLYLTDRSERTRRVRRTRFMVPIGLARSVSGWLMWNSVRMYRGVKWSLRAVLIIARSTCRCA